MKLKKTELFDMLLFSDEYLAKNFKSTYEKKCKLLDEIDARIRENNHIEIIFVEDAY